MQKPPLLVRLARHLRTKWKSYLGNLVLVLVLVVLAGVQLWQTRHVPSGPAPDRNGNALAAVVGQADQPASQLEPAR